MFKKLPLGVLLVCLFANFVLADLGFDRIIINSTGRCWRILNRSYEQNVKYDSCVLFRVVNVGGSGQTDDPLAFELTFKEDYIPGQGWDESKTRTYEGSGLVKSVTRGRVNFELYLGSNEQPIEITGYYHPGNGSSNYDDRVILNLPETITQPGNSNNDCDPIVLEDSTVDL
ncbi:MAG: hypothetical protein AAGA30_05635 [Planctomycetota bacterium]